MKHIILALLVMIMSFSAYAGEKETAYDRVMRTGTLRCGYTVYPPFILMDANTKKLSGLTVEIVESLANELHFKVDWSEEVTPSTAFESINLGRYDVLCVPFWLTAPRFKVAEPTIPIAYDGYYAVVRQDDKRFKTYEDLNSEHVTIAYQEGVAIQPMIPKSFPKAKVLEEMSLSGPFLQLEDVIHRKADVAFIEKATLHDFEKQKSGQLKVLMPKPFAIMSESFWVAHGDLELKALLDNTLTVLQNNGEIKRILNKYGGTNLFMFSRPMYDDTLGAMK